MLLLPFNLAPQEVLLSRDREEAVLKFWLQHATYLVTLAFRDVTRRLMTLSAMAVLLGWPPGDGMVAL
jgi:hypothetical protein